MQKLLFATITLGLCYACAPQPVTPLISRSIAPNPPIQSGIKNAYSHQRQKVVAKARQLVRTAGSFKSGGFTFQRDAVGFVQAAYWHAGIDVFDPQLALNPDLSGAALVFNTALKRRQLFKKLPRPGDLVFFRNSYASKNRGLPPRQIAIVESIDSNLTATALGVFSNGPKRIVLNLTQKKRDYAADGKRINDRLSSIKEEKGESAGLLLQQFANPFEITPQEIATAP
jgi:hypothetical protein